MAAGSGRLALLCSLPIVLAALPHAECATLANRYSFSAVDDASDSVGGNDGIPVNGAYVEPTEGGLVLPGIGTSLDAASMIFEDFVDLGFTYDTTGVTIETWFTDSGTGTWGKLFHFGRNEAGFELAYTNFRGGGNIAPGLDRNGAIPLTTWPFGSNTRPPLEEEHHLVVAVESDGTTTLWMNGVKEIDSAATNDLFNIGSEVETIGATSWGDPGHFGSVNEFRIWEGTLTDLEVNSNFIVGPDTIPDPGETDVDADGLLDAWEIKWFPDAVPPLSPEPGDDPDEDQLTNLEEFQTNPLLNPDDPDSDDDGLSDGAEVKTHMTLPLNPDTDGDGLTDGAEVNDHGTEPLFADTDLDFYDDGWEVANMTDPNDPDDPGVPETAEMTHRYSFSEGGELVDSVGGNSGVLHGTAEVSGGTLQLDGFGSGADASSMRFTDPIDFGRNYAGSGASIEAWFTDVGTGTWGKLFTFGTSVAGQEIAWTSFRGGSDLAPGLDRNGAIQIATIPFGSNDRLSFDDEHHIAVTVAGDGTTNLFIDGEHEIIEAPTNPLSNVVTLTESIGSTAWNDPGHWGEVTEFRIYRGELTAEEVAQNFADGPDAGGGGGDADFVITGVAWDAGAGTVTVTWNSVAGRRYAVYVSDALAAGAPPEGWLEVFDADATADTMTYVDTPPGTAGIRFYRIGDVTTP